MTLYAVRVNQKCYEFVIPFLLKYINKKKLPGYTVLYLVLKSHCKHD